MASIGKTPSGRSATTGQLRRQVERAARVERAGNRCRPLFSCPPRNKYALPYVVIGMSPGDPAAAGLPPTAAEQLPDDVATLKRMVLELLASLHERDRDLEGLRHRINLLLRRLYGPRGERFDPNQPLLFPEMAAGQDTPTEAPAEPAPPSQPKRRCRPHGRRRLP